MLRDLGVRRQRAPRWKPTKGHPRGEEAQHRRDAAQSRAVALGIVMAYIVMAYTVMAYIVMAYIVMAQSRAVALGDAVSG